MIHYFASGVKAQVLRGKKGPHVRIKTGKTEIDSQGEVPVWEERRPELEKSVANTAKVGS